MIVLLKDSDKNKESIRELAVRYSQLTGVPIDNYITCDDYYLDWSDPFLQWNCLVITDKIRLRIHYAKEN